MFTPRNITIAVFAAAFLVASFILGPDAAAAIADRAGDFADLFLSLAWD